MTRLTQRVLLPLLIVCLLAHHAIKHRNDDVSVRFFNVRDIKNHETWVLVCIALLVGISLVTH